jgi:ATP phosphoribosyltransferase regulatory subunit
MSAWLLPDHIADVLPSEARNIEELRRCLLDTARSFGYELVIPPLLEHLESLLTGAGEALDLQTFKLVDQISGRMMGLRADTTQQAARIDAHLLNRRGVTRLCYCGPVLHTWPDRPHATREPLQFGAELYGHAGPEADLEALDLARACLEIAGVRDAIVDLADVRIVRALMAGVSANHDTLRHVFAALAAKDVSELALVTRDFPNQTREGLLALVRLYGDISVLDEASACLAHVPGVAALLDGLRWLADRIDGCQVRFDLSDLRGYAYYSGARFGIYTEAACDALVRGGRYDQVGAVFGRDRPAAGFSLDVKQLVMAAPVRPLKPAIRAPWGDAADLRQVISELRAQGETVVCVMPGHESEVQEFQCDRELTKAQDRWSIRSIV